VNSAVPVHRRPWLLTLPVAVLVVLCADYLGLHTNAWSLAVDWPAAYSLVLVVAAAYLAPPALAAQRTRLRRTLPAPGRQRPSSVRPRALGAPGGVRVAPLTEGPALARPGKLEGS
jgi:hypothetical protein